MDFHLPTVEEIAQYLRPSFRKDCTVFYSGEGTGDEALEFAKARDYHHWYHFSEMIALHYGIDPYHVHNDVNDDLQSRICQAYGLAASGKVYVFLSSAPLTKSTFWTRDEWPALQVNPAVTEIVSVSLIEGVYSEITIFVKGQAPKPWPLAVEEPEPGT